MKRIAVPGIRPSGMGFAICHTLAVEQGFEVYTCDREEALAREAVEILRREGGKVEFMPADVSRQEDVDRFADFILDRADGPLDALVHNAGHAGVPVEDNLHDLSADAFRELLDVNLVAAFLTTQAAVGRLFGRGGGTCIYLSTNNGRIGSLGQLGYGVAKQGLPAMARILAAEYAGSGHRFLSVSPGVIQTNSANWQRRRKLEPNWVRWEGGMNPMGRIGRPADVAGVVAFLLSDSASFINGCDLCVDGGLRETGLMFPGMDAANARESYIRLAEKLDVADRKAA